MHEALSHGELNHCWTLGPFQARRLCRIPARMNMKLRPWLLITICSLRVYCFHYDRRVPLFPEGYFAKLWFYQISCRYCLNATEYIP